MWRKIKKNIKLTMTKQNLNKVKRYFLGDVVALRSVPIQTGNDTKTAKI